MKIKNKKGILIKKNNGLLLQVYLFLLDKLVLKLIIYRSLCEQVKTLIIVNQSKTREILELM